MPAPPMCACRCSARTRPQCRKTAGASSRPRFSTSDGGPTAYRGRLELHLFGELEVIADDGSVVPIRGARLRVLLALLALHRGEPVSAERLIDAVWADEPPSKPANALQALVASLRRALGASNVTTTGTGYALGIEAEQIDVVRFDRLITGARDALDAGDAAAAVHSTDLAMALCRGEPLAELAFI